MPSQTYWEQLCLLWYSIKDFWYRLRDVPQQFGAGLFAVIAVTLGIAVIIAYSGHGILPLTSLALFSCYWLYAYIMGISDPLPAAEVTAPSPWIRINHSDPEIRWRMLADTALLYSIREAMQRHSPHRYLSFHGIDQLLEYNSSRIYRVNPFIGEGLFLKLHIAVNTPDIQEKLEALREEKRSELALDQKIVEALNADNVFGDSNFSRCVVPLASDRGGNSTDVEIWMDDRKLTAYLAEVYPLANAANHYPGKNDQQLISVARKLGTLQSTVAKLSPDTLKTRVIPTNSSYGGDFANLRKHFELIDLVTRERRATNPSKFISSYLANLDIIRQWVNLCEPFVEELHSEPLVPLLHDVHPHNVLFVGNECKLICDYQVAGLWRHGDVVAYSLHRFCRELIRNQADSSEENIRRVSELFLSNYRAAGAPKLPTAFEHSIHMRVGIISLFKLRTAMMNALDIWLSPVGRIGDANSAEVVKFISFLMEADMIGKALTKGVGARSTQNP